MVKENRLPHALLLCGPQGAGKMALAMAFASYLLCKTHDEDDACGHCSQCAMLSKWAHPDLMFTYPVIRPAGTSSEHKMSSDDFINEWREMLIGVGESDLLLRKLSLKSSQGGYKVNIIWLPERMNAECANKMLKVIEEPPTETVFIMVCEEPELLLETIRSRTQRIDVKRLDNGEIEDALVRLRGIDADAAHRIARAAAGSWLNA